MKDPRQCFVDESVSTASPIALLLMLFDRLMLDVDQAAVALRSGAQAEYSEKLMHAQQIIGALHSSVDSAQWEGAEDLIALYDHMFGLLVKANTLGSEESLLEARSLIGPLREAWIEAAATTEGASVLNDRAVQIAQGKPAESGGILGVA